MADSGIRHVVSSVPVSKSQYEDQAHHELIHGTSFPASPSERQLFYRDDLHKWYIYNGSSWVETTSQGVTVHNDLTGRSAAGCHPFSAISSKTLNGLDDVSVASPTDGYVLYWDAGTSLWKCKAISGTKIQDADGDTKVDTEESADEDKIRMDVAGVEAFLLHDDGILDLAKQSRARGYRSAAQSIPDSTYTKVEIDTEVFDEQNELDVATNHRFTASVAGYYYCYGIVTLVNLGDGKKIIVAIYVNGTNAGYARTTVGGTDYAGMAASIVQYLEANDYVELYVYHNHGAALNVSPHTHSVALGVHKLS